MNRQQSAEIIVSAVVYSIYVMCLSINSHTAPTRTDRVTRTQKNDAIATTTTKQRHVPQATQSQRRQWERHYECIHHFMAVLCLLWIYAHTHSVLCVLIRKCCHAKWFIKWTTITLPRHPQHPGFVRVVLWLRGGLILDQFPQSHPSTDRSSSWPMSGMRGKGMCVCLSLWLSYQHKLCLCDVRIVLYGCDVCLRLWWSRVAQARASKSLVPKYIYT